MQPGKGMYTLNKSLGQHFLRDEGMARRIVDALPVKAGAQVLEIGPGGGALTRWLKEIPDISFRAIEIDAEKVGYLHGQYPDLEGKLLTGDILNTDPPFEGAFSIIGNFPYNISSQILFRTLEWKQRVPLVVGMFQKEVAQRICSLPGSKVYGILSVLTQAFYETEYLFELAPALFEPPPKVTSAVIRLRYMGNRYGIADEKKFFSLVKSSFNQRRKMLRNPLKSRFPPLMLKLPIFGKRAEELSVAEFVELSKHML